METNTYLWVTGMNGAGEPRSVLMSRRRQHVYVIGQTGAGKSTLLRNLILQDHEAGRVSASLTRTAIWPWTS